MLIKAVPYYPVVMRTAHRMNHHLNVACNKSYAVTQPGLRYGKGVEHYGK